tara:strand:- start:23 stop:820 length:798 start_codon:yes stop_codon:yes gene_type:complete
MKKLILLFLFIPLVSFGQYDSNKLKPTSVKNFNSFLNYAKTNNKLVIISFSTDKNPNATSRIPQGMMTSNIATSMTGLCEKCDMLNKELWNSEEFRRLENYILIEININDSYAERLITKYSRYVKSIPKVIIEVANNEGDIINEGLDIRSAILSLNELEYLNKLDFAQVYAAGTDNRKIGEAYRELHKNDKKNLFKRILELSTKHFRRALKKEKNKINQLNILYNLKLKGSHKKANKKLDKLKLDKANLSDIENEIIQKIIDNSN